MATFSWIDGEHFRRNGHGVSHPHRHTYSAIDVAIADGYIGKTFSKLFSRKL